MFTNGSWLDNGAAGYSVVRKNGQCWADIKTQMGYNQETYDPERAALARALKFASRRNSTPQVDGCFERKEKPYRSKFSLM
jgi:hypothetical protein